MKKAPRKSRKYTWIEITVGIVGLILSVVLHELFHVILHWGQVSHIGLFPQHSGAIVELSVALPEGYDVEGEEMVAYLITVIVMLITTAIIFRIHDAGDKRTSSQILFPENKEMQKLSPPELLDLAEKADPGQVGLTPEHPKKPRQ